MSFEQDVIAELLGAIREESGKTQSELAELLGVTQSTVSKLERGERNVDLVYMLALCRAVGIDFPSFASRLESKLAHPSSSEAK